MRNPALRPPRELEGWRAGGLEGWRAGGLEGWRAGGLEGLEGLESFSATQPVCGSVALTGGHTAHFTPAAGFTGLSSFTFTVTGSDDTTYPGRVGVVVRP